MPSWRTKPLPPNWGRTRRRILRRDRGICYQCGQPAAHVDHIIPASRGGGDEDANLAAICPRCHASKTAAEANAANPLAVPRKRPQEKHPGDLT